MERDWIDVLLGVLLTAFLLWSIKLLGYGIERLLKRNTSTRVIAGIDCVVLEEAQQRLAIGGKRLIQSQMEAIIKASNVEEIVFYDGSNNLTAKAYASYRDGMIKFLDSGRIVKLD